MGGYGSAGVEREKPPRPVNYEGTTESNFNEPEPLWGPEADGTAADIAAHQAAERQPTEANTDADQNAADAGQDNSGFGDTNAGQNAGDAQQDDPGFDVDWASRA